MQLKAMVNGDEVCGDFDGYGGFLLVLLNAFLSVDAASCHMGG